MEYNHSIALIGTGGISNYGSLPVYKKHNMHVTGCYDIKREVALVTADKWHIPHVYNSLDEIMRDKDVDIVEIAVTPWDQPDIAYQMAAAGKHLLCQKPLCDNLKIAKSLVRAVDVFEVKLAVNQQFRWSPMIVKMRELLTGNYLGNVLDVTLRVRANTPWTMWPWLMMQSKLEVMYHSIHYLDALRMLFGEPHTVSSRHFHTDTRVAGESKTVTVLSYAPKQYNDFQVTLDIHHHPEITTPEATLEICGSNGTAKGYIGTMYDYPNGRNDTVNVTFQSGGTIYYQLDGQWIPDAFIGPISSLISAIDNDTEPETSGRDNLKTLELVDACYKSATSNRVIWMRNTYDNWAKLNK